MTPTPLSVHQDHGGPPHSSFIQRVPAHSPPQNAPPRGCCWAPAPRRELSSETTRNVAASGSFSSSLSWSGETWKKGGAVSALPKHTPPSCSPLLPPPHRDLLIPALIPRHLHIHCAKDMATQGPLCPHPKVQGLFHPRGKFGAGCWRKAHLVSPVGTHKRMSPLAHHNCMPNSELTRLRVPWLSPTANTPRPGSATAHMGSSSVTPDSGREPCRPPEAESHRLTRRPADTASSMDLAGRRAAHTQGSPASPAIRNSSSADARLQALT